MKYLLLDAVTDQSIRFETGKPVSFPFARNTEKSPYVGATYQQDIEPAGRYVILDYDSSRVAPRPWVQGRMRFEQPLVLRFVPRGVELGYGPQSWKARLAREFGSTGRRLSAKLRKLGFDGIVTTHAGETREIVAL